MNAEVMAHNPLLLHPAGRAVHDKQHAPAASTSHPAINTSAFPTAHLLLQPTCS